MGSLYLCGAQRAGKEGQERKEERPQKVEGGQRRSVIADGSFYAAAKRKNISDYNSNKTIDDLRNDYYDGEEETMILYQMG